MKIGYARVSTQDQSLELQIEALEKAGCERIFKEKISAVKERPQLEKLNNMLRPGDTIIIWKLDLLGRSLKHLIDLVNFYRKNEVELISVQDNIDTTTAQGRLMFNIFATIAEFERELISERTKAGLARAKRLGRTGGRPRGITPESKRKAYAIGALLEKKDKDGKALYSLNQIQKELNIKKGQYYRLLDWLENQSNTKNNKRTNKR